VERHHRRILHRWLARSTRRLPVDAQRRDIMCYPAGCHRGCLNWLQPHDGRQHKARCAPTTTSRRGCTIWRRRHGCGRVKRFRFTIYTSSERTVIRPRAGSDMSDVWASGVFGMFGIYRRFRQRAAFTLSSALCYTCIIYATRLVQHLEASLEESMSVRNSEDTTHLNVHQLLRSQPIDTELTAIV